MFLGGQFFQARLVPALVGAIDWAAKLGAEPQGLINLRQGAMIHPRKARSQHSKTDPDLPLWCYAAGVGCEVCGASPKLLSATSAAKSSTMLMTSV